MTPVTNTSPIKMTRIRYLHVDRIRIEVVYRLAVYNKGKICNNYQESQTVNINLSNGFMVVKAALG